jgi:hypothetical protein
MEAEQLPSIWSKDAFICKAQRYASIMLGIGRNDWQFGFWSALLLETLARASLSNISPVLVADEKDWNNIYFALGNDPNTPKFSPKSADIAEILRRVAAIFPMFTKEMLNFSTTHIRKRNSELHSGDLPFDTLRTSEWLPMYYLTCKAILDTLEENLDVIFGEPESKLAGILIDALQDEAAKAVQGVIKSHKIVWEAKSEEEREIFKKQAETLATRQTGHRVQCPSCDSPASLQGSSVGAPVRSIEDELGLIVVKQSMFPTSFECTACGLKISGYSKLQASGLGESFTSTLTFDAAEYFGIEPTEDDSYEPDFND